MKPDREQIQVESTLQGEDIELTIDETARAHIINVLTDIASDTIMYPIREYLTNAKDANQEAGYEGPVRVSRPTALRPTLTIADNGTGLSVEDIRTTYSKYGASTKRGTDEAVGMLGLGCKSALTYTDQFTVESVKDGRHATVSISRREDGSASAKVLKDEASDEPNGTKVSIPVKHGDADEFNEKLDGFVRFWQPGEVEVNGKAPEFIGQVEGTYKLTNDLLVVPGEPNDWIVMGGVPYPAELEIFEDVASYYRSRGRKGVVAFVPIGTVNFTPSREELLMNKRTERAIAKVKADFEAAAADAIERDVSQATSKPEAMTAYYEAARALDLLGNAPEVKYKGKVVPRRIGYKKDDDKAIPQKAYHYRYRGYNGEAVNDPDTMRVLNGAEASYRGSMNDNRRTTGLGPDDLTGTTIWITDFFPEKFNADQRRRIDAYRKHKGLDAPDRFVLVRRKSVPMKDWVDTSEVWDWQELRKWKDPNAKTAPVSGKKLRGSYFTRSASTGRYDRDETLAADLPDEDLYWMRGSKYDGVSVIESLVEHAPKAVLVLLPENRVAKFERDFPHAINFTETVAAARFQKWDQLTARQQALLGWGGTSYEDILRTWKPDEVDDPDVRKVIEAIADQRSALDSGLDRNDLEFLPPAPKGEAIPTDRDLMRSYPILDNYRYGGSPSPKQRKHLLLYINAAYAAEQEDE